MGLDPALQRLVDIEDIRRVIYRYFYSVDSSDVAGTLSCFTEDVRQEWNGGVTILEGLEPMAEWVRKYAEVRTLQTHHASNIDVEIDGDSAHSETRVLAFLLGDQLMELADGAEPPQRQILRARGTGLSDDLVRTPEGWKIRFRRHRAYWQYEVDALDTVAEAYAVHTFLGGVAQPGAANTRA